METWILKKIRAVSVRRVVAWGLALVGSVLLFTSDRRYVDNFLHGPYTLAAADLDAIEDVTTTPRYYARVTGTRVIDTGLREYAVTTSAGVEKSRSEAGAYYALVVNDKFLIFKSREDPSNVVEGRLVPWPSKLESEMFDSKEMKELRPRFYSFYVQDGSFQITAYWMIAGALLLIVLLVWKGRPAWRYARDPSAHPLVARTAAWVRGDPMVVAVEAEREFDAPRFKGGHGWRVGEKYLVRSSFFTFDLLRFQDLLWAYKKITKHSVNFIPTGKTYEAILACYGGTATITGKEKRVDEILAFSEQRAPWAVLGYSDELSTMFNKKTDEFAGAVEQRRREWQEKGGKV
jgi:uncharacterized protein DUF6709